jgi:hypothetical protein
VKFKTVLASGWAGTHATGIRRMLWTAAICCSLCASSLAQQGQSAPPPDAPSSTPQDQTEPHSNNPIQSSMGFFSLLQRKSLVFPNLATNQGPLSPWQKFKLAANNSISLATITSDLLGAAYGQAINSPSGYGQGGEGYGKRVGAELARSTSSNLFGTFMLASMLHQDPRFYVKKNLSFMQSVKYAAVTVFVTRSDSGKQVTNYSGLIGPLLAEGLANAYYPDQNRDVSSTFARYGADLGWKFGGNLLRQYWPTLNRRLRLAPTAPASTPASTTSPNQL